MRKHEQANGPFFYLALPSRFGQLGIVWYEAGGRAVVQRVFLPRPPAAVEDSIFATFSGALRGRHPAMADLGARMQAFLAGEAISFALGAVALENCSTFQRHVLVAEHGIPRGRVSTYGLIAAHVGVPQGARAVGTALARNPFPLIIPCHRAIRCSGDLGGYQGGLDMKRRLLETEGVEVSQNNRVVRAQLHYAPLR